MKTLFIFTTLLFASGSFGLITPGSFATERLLKELGGDILYGKTSQDKPCVVDVVFPNSYHHDTVVRVYPGIKIDDVPEEAAWIRIEPSQATEYQNTRYSLIVKSTEIRPDEEGYTKIFSQIYVGFDPLLEKKIVTVKTQSSYFPVREQHGKKSSRMNLMTCYIGR